MNDKTRVLIIDDHPLFRRGVSQLLELNQGFELVGEAASGQEGIDLAKRLDPDLILLDLNMKGMSGLETLSTMRDMEIDARIILITVSNAPEDLVAAIRAGLGAAHRTGRHVGGRDLGAGRSRNHLTTQGGIGRLRTRIGNGAQCQAADQRATQQFACGAMAGLACMRAVHHIPLPG